MLHAAPTPAPAGVGSALAPYRSIWAVDFEFVARPGDRPEPVCLVARELRSGRLVRLFGEQLRGCVEPPYPSGPGDLFVAYYASAELGCHRALGWPMPERVLDLYVEFRNRTAGLAPPHGAGLVGALLWFTLDPLDAVEKQAMRELVLRGGPYDDVERAAILDYCQGDVDALTRLLPAMLPEIDLPRALLRGRYMAAAARIEWTGVPIDLETLGRLRGRWDNLQDRLIAEVDRDYGVFDGRRFKSDRWDAWLARRGIPWPRLDSGAPALDDDTFREMARSHPDVALMRELRHALSQLRLADLAVGSDSRNRCLLSAFASKTGRNQPSNSRFIFGPSVWLRGLIRPSEGRALAYIDWSQQEFGIAAALSGDLAMREAYLSGDPYLAFGKQAGRIPADGTKQTHKAVRDLFKACTLGVQYGMGEVSLGRRIGQPPVVARDLLRMHRQTYPTFWRWSDDVEQHAMLYGSLHTVFGWTLRVGPDANPRSLRNFFFACRRMELRCSGWPAAWRPSAGSRSAHRCTTRCSSRVRPPRSTRSWPRPSVRCARRPRSSWTASRCGPTPSRPSSSGPIATWTTGAGGCGTASCGCWRSRNRSTWRRRQELPGAGGTPVQSYFLYLSLGGIMDPPFDVESYRLPPSATAPPRPSKRPPRHQAGEPFLRGPIPWAWLDRAGRQTGRALAVGLVLWQRSGVTGNRTVRLCQSSLSDLGLNEATTRRGLRALEAAGLVAIQRLPGRGLDVTILDPTSAWPDA
jgi:hypothetical protein